MKYGLELPNGGPIGNPRVLTELASLAETSGWDGIFIEDYIVWQGHPEVPAYDPWVLLAAMAMTTERIRLGTTVTPVTRRRPWKLAGEAVSIDHLSNGRLTLGVGLGDVADQSFTAVGEVTDTLARARMFDECVDVITGLWSGRALTFEGHYFQVHGLTLVPPPVQSPRIPIWVGGNWPHRGVIKRAARFDGFVGGKEHGENEDWRLTVDEIAELKAQIDGSRTDPRSFDIALGGAPRGADPAADRDYIRSAAKAGATWWMEYLPPDFGGLNTIRSFIKGGPLL